MQEKKGILIVSFGTSHADTRRRTLTAIEDKIQASYPDLPVYSAWTSKMIIKKLGKTTGEKILSVTEALTLMAQDGITDVSIQPTHVMNGIENDRMKEEAQKLLPLFHSMRFGTPLVSCTEDMRALIQIVVDTYREVKEGEALILMGHGSEHHSNTVYAALDYMCKEMGYPNIYVGTVEAYPTLENVLESLKECPAKTIHLAPLMIVAGDHAMNDMAGDQEDSWRNICESSGYRTVCHLRGLGEIPAVQELFIRHLDRIL